MNRPEKTIRCPYCDTQLIAILDSNWYSSKKEFSLKYHCIPRHGKWTTEFSITNELVVCTNENCRKPIFNTNLSGTHHITWSYQFWVSSNYELEIWKWDLLPDSHSKHFSDTIVPAVIIEDYEEACKIIGLSPKASATLLRRCLQGMIRDFWGIVESTLFKEIDELKQVVHDSDIIDAIDTLRSTGNIWAHMEKDINMIIDIDEWEVEQLKWLIEFLIEEWYMKRYEKNLKLQWLKALWVAKQIQKQITP